MGYEEFTRKLAYPVVNPRRLVVKSSLVDHFLPVFIETVNSNPIIPANQVLYTEPTFLCSYSNTLGYSAPVMHTFYILP